MTPSFEQDTTDRLARMEERLKAGDKRFDAFDRHVQDCAADKRSLRMALIALTGSVIVGACIMAAAVLRVAGAA